MNSTILLNTKPYQHYYRTGDIQWILPMSINIILTAVVLWIIMSLIHYGIKTKKFKQVRRSNSEKLNAGMIFASVIACAFTSLILYCLLLLYINVEPSKWSKQQCNDLTDAIKLFYSLSIFFVNLFLWLRQKVFYSNNMFNVQYSKPIKVFSYLSIFLILIGILIILIVSSLPVDNIFSGTSCVYKREKDYNRTISLIIGIFVYAFGQISLFSLICYALLKPKYPHQQLVFGIFQSVVFRKNLKQQNITTNKMEQANIPDVSSCGKSGDISLQRKSQFSQSKKTSSKVNSILKKSFFFVIFSMLIDIIYLFVKYQIRHSFLHLWTIALSANIIINLLLVIMSFIEWKEMLLSPCQSV